MNVEVNILHDMFGVGKALQAIPNTINAVSNAPKNLAQAGEIFVNTVGKVPEVVDKFSKTFEEHVDRNNERRIKQIRQANLSNHLSEKDKEQLRANVKQIIERNGVKFYNWEKLGRKLGESWERLKNRQKSKDIYIHLCSKSGLKLNFEPHIFSQYRKKAEK